MTITVLLLAAGQSKRFGSIKQLAPYNGRPLISHCLMQYYANGLLLQNIDDLILVLGSHGEIIQKAIPDGISNYVVKDWALGMGQSIAETMQNVSIASSHVMIALGDQIAINTNIVNKMLLTSCQYPSKIIAAKYANQLGAPAIFPAQYFVQLKDLSADTGARRIIKKNMNNVVSLNIPEGAYDIDTPEDLLSYIKRNK